MIKFTSKIDLTMFLCFAFVLVLDVCATMLWGIFGIWIPFVIITAVLFVFVIPPFFGTYYYLTEDYLIVNSFWFCINKKIKYEDIVVAVPKTFCGFGPALSDDGIEIVYKQDGKTKQIFISPAMQETFLNQLTDNIMVGVVLESKKAEQSEETKQYLQKKQEIEEQKAKNSSKTITLNKPKEKKVNKNKTKVVSKKKAEPKAEQKAKVSKKVTVKKEQKAKTSTKKVTKSKATKPDQKKVATKKVATKAQPKKVVKKKVKRA